jgi:hypothetical protein
MGPAFSWLLVGIVCAARAAEIHRFGRDGDYRPTGFPESPPVLLAFAEKPLRLHFQDPAADRRPAVRVDRITAARRISLPVGDAAVEATPDGWTWTWIPPAARGPVRYEVRFEGEPTRVVRIETRDPAWREETLQMLRRADWKADGLSADERSALADHGLRVGRASTGGARGTAALQMTARRGDSARRRVVWDERQPGLVVWRPGPAAGDVEIRAPRWWISPEALATDQGLIRLLDLFSEPPHNP